MTTSTSPPAEPGRPDDGRVPLRLRLRMSEHPGHDRLDGGWWPRSRDLAVELADLVDHLPDASGRVVQALISPPDWDTAPLRIPVAGGSVRVESLPDDDTHVIHLQTAEGATLHVLVVPPSYSGPQGDEALLAAATAGNAHAAPSLLATVTEHPDVDPADHWDDGRS